LGWWRWPARILGGGRWVLESIVGGDSGGKVLSRSWCQRRLVAASGGCMRGFESSLLYYYSWYVLIHFIKEKNPAYYSMIYVETYRLIVLKKLFIRLFQIMIVQKHQIKVMNEWVSVSEWVSEWKSERVYIRVFLSLYFSCMCVIAYSNPV